MGSGKGTNCYSLLDAFASGLLNTTEIIGVFSDNPNSGILDIAKGAKIPGLYLGPYDRLNAEKDKSWIDEIKKLNLDYIKIETLTDNLQLVPQLDKGIEISFDAVNSKLHIQKFK